MVWMVMAVLGGCTSNKEPVEGASCPEGGRSCDSGNSPFVCGSAGVWEKAPLYCVCAEDTEADEDEFGDVQCAVVASR